MPCIPRGATMLKLFALVRFTKASNETHLNCYMDIPATVCAHDVSLQRKWNDAHEIKYKERKYVHNFHILMVKWMECENEIRRWKSTGCTCRFSFPIWWCALIRTSNGFDVTLRLSFNYKLNATNETHFDNNSFFFSVHSVIRFAWWASKWIFFFDFPFNRN